MSKRLFVSLCLLALIVPLGLSAQSSNTSDATQGIFRTNTDNFMDVTQYSSVQNSLFFLGLENSGEFNVGFGIRAVPELFLGLAYNGNAFSQNYPTVTTSVDSQLLLNNNVVTGSTVTTSSQTTGDTTSMNNNGYILAGFGPIAVKLGVQQSGNTLNGRFNVPGYQSSLSSANAFAATTDNPSLDTGSITSSANQSDSTSVTYAADGTTVIGRQTTAYTNGKKDNSSIAPTLTIGGAIDLGDGIFFLPSISGSVAFITDTFTQTYDRKLESIGSGLPTYDSVAEVLNGTKISVNTANNQTSINAGANLAVEMPVEKGMLKVTAAYSMWLPIYSSAYLDTAGATQTVVGNGIDAFFTDYNANTQNNSVTNTRLWETNTISNRMWNQGALTARFSGPLADGLQAGIQLYAPVGFYNYTQVNAGATLRTETYTHNIDPTQSYTNVITKSKSGATNTYSSVNFSPVISGGLQAAIVKDLLVLNVGGRVTAPNLFNSVNSQTRAGISTVTEVKTMGDGTVSTNTYNSTVGDNRSEFQSVVTDWNGLSTNVTAGITLLLGGGVSLDASIDSGVLNASTVNGTLSGSNISTYKAPTFTLQLQITK
jgi:hypothetical protein